MASGHTKKPFCLNLKLKEKRDRLDKPQPLKILVQNGIVLRDPTVVENTKALAAANRLREDAPKSERMIAVELAEMGFEHSVAMIGYVMDFYHPTLRICVEIDGAVHRGRKARDRSRDRKLMAIGIETYRFWASSVYAEKDRIVSHIRHLVAIKSPLHEFRPTSFPQDSDGI